MRALKLIVLIGLLAAITALVVLPPAAMAKRDLGTETLAQNDGWASEGAGTTGGSAATSDHVYNVHNRQELIAALNLGGTSASNTAKIIYVVGTIDANVDDNNQPLTCPDYYRSGYTLEGFLAAYDPAVWGRANAPSGPMETARLASQAAQQARVRIRIGSNTTIVGAGNNATIRGAWFDIRGSSATSQVSNIVIRNLAFQDTYDCFPAWTPTDGATGNWNALYDAISLRYANHVWIDHNSFADITTADSTAPTYFGRHFEMHDGLCDITNASDLVTVSWNRFMNHDKVMLIGSGDNAPADVGRLRVTIHHNLFDSLGQRTPRVRYGQVHIYNNYYKIVDNPGFVYSWGVGIQSAIYAENNYFQTDQSIAPSQVIGVYNGTKIYASGTRLNGTPGGGFTDIVAAYNAVYDPNLSGNAGWTPTLFTAIDDTQKVVSTVHSGAGPFNW